MEDWSYVPLDLDAARDVQHIWKSLADLHRREHGWTEQNIVDYFCRAITLDNRISNTSIIALVEVLRVKNLRVPPHLKVIAEDAIHQELAKSKREGLEAQDCRRSALTEMLIFLAADTKRRCDGPGSRFSRTRV